MGRKQEIIGVKNELEERQKVQVGHVREELGVLRRRRYRTLGRVRRSNIGGRLGRLG